MGRWAHKWSHRFPAFCTKILLRSWGIRLVQHNTALLKNLPPCVIVLNHRCDLDALIATAYMPGIFKFIGKKDLERYPFIGRLVSRLYITVDRSSAASKKESIAQMQKQAAHGANIVVFPEGWSNFSNEYLLELKRGAFKVAIDNNMPMLVGTFIGTHELFPKPKIEIHPGTAHLFWETIISTDGMEFDRDNMALRAQVKEIMLQRLKAHYPDGYVYPKDQMDFETWRKKQLKKTSGSDK